MADKKTISIEFKEEGGVPDASTPPPTPDPKNPAQSQKLDSDASRIVEDILKRFQEDNKRIDERLAGEISPANQGPNDDGSWRWQNEAGLNPDPFGIFDTSGVNVDDIQASIDSLNAEFQSLSESAQNAARAGVASSNAASNLAGGANAAAAALGGGGGAGGGIIIPVNPGGLGGLSGGVGGLAGAAGIASAALLGIVGSALAFNEVVDGLVEMVGNLSGDVAAASAESRVQEIQDRIRLAQEVGPEVGDLERTRSDVASELRGITRELIESMTPLIELGGLLTREMITPIRQQLEAFNDLVEMIGDLTGTSQDTLSILSPTLDLVRDFLKWYRGKEKLVNTPQQMVDDLFNPQNIGVRPPGKNQMRDKGDPLA